MDPLLSRSSPDLFFRLMFFLSGNRSRSRFKCQRSSFIINEILLHQTELCCSFETSRASRGCGGTKAKNKFERKSSQLFNSLSLGRPALDIYILFPQLPFWFWHLEMNGRHLLSVCLCVYSLKGRIRAQNWLERNIWRSISADDTHTKIKGLDRGIWLKFECYIRRGFWLIEIFGGLFCIIWSRSDGCHRHLIKLETAVHTICYIRCCSKLMKIFHLVMAVGQGEHERGRYCWFWGVYICWEFGVHSDTRFLSFVAPAGVCIYCSCHLSSCNPSALFSPSRIYMGLYSTRLGIL